MKTAEKSVQLKRDNIIEQMANSASATEFAKNNADDLFALDLTTYSSLYSLDSAIYNAFSISELDDNISLHPEQLEIISLIDSNDALVVSAPTSFGKTLCVFEYIVKRKPRNIVLIVPTLALVDEYMKKIIKRFKKSFTGYKIHTNLSEEKEYDFTQKNIFILTHDRIAQDNMGELIKEIDFLVIDEVLNDDRVLVMNVAYAQLAKKTKKYVLLAPFIKEIQHLGELDKKPFFYRTEYSPVVNKIFRTKLIREEDRFIECKKILDKKRQEKTLVYFPTVTGKHGMYKYINDVIMKEKIVSDLPDSIELFLQWAREEIHEEWAVVKALERGYLIHNGQIPIGTRMFQIDQYDSGNNNTMLCTSSLLEGVNTSAENIIIVKPARKVAKEGECFSAFDFYNLVGRSGRLNEHMIGNAFYLQGPKDEYFNKEDAVKSIRFEITDNTDDMDIQRGTIDENERIKAFLEMLSISLEEYRENIGTKLRFSTVYDLLISFNNNKEKLLSILMEMAGNKTLGRYNLVKCLLEIYQDCNKHKLKLDASIITSLLNKRRPQIRSVVEDARKYFNREIDVVISETIRLKNSYIEHTFCKKTLLIVYFCQLSGVSEEYINVIKSRIIEPIEILYFLNTKNKKMLLDLGIYERDIDKIIKVIGADFEDTVDLKNRLVKALPKLKITYLSKYVINSLS